MGKGLHDAGITLAGRIGALIATIATQSILAWSLGTEGRGSLAVCLLFSTIMVLIFSIGCDIGALYFVSSKRFNISEGYFYSLIFGTVCSLAAMIVGWGIIKTSIPFFEKASQNAFLLSLWLIPTKLFGTMFHRLLTAVKLFRHYAAITLLRALLQLTLTFCFVRMVQWGVQGAILATILTGTLIFIICSIVYIHEFDIKLIKPSFKKFAAMLSYGAHYYLGKISNMAKIQIGTVFLAFFATKSDIGLFAISSRLIKLVEMIPEAITTALFPRIAADKDGRKDLVVKTSRISLIVCGGIFSLLTLFTTPLVRIVFSPDFLPAVPLIRILAIGGVLYCMAKIFLSYLVATKHPGIASVAVMIGVIVNIILLYFLLPKFGVIAAAWAMSANYIISSIIILLLFKRLSGLKYSEIFGFCRSDWSEFANWRTVISRKKNNSSEIGGKL